MQWASSQPPPPPPPPLCFPDLQDSAERGEADESLAVPLLEQNRPPLLPGKENEELADVELRPDSVSALATAGWYGAQANLSFMRGSFDTDTCGMYVGVCT